MAVKAEANSLAAITQLASNPPNYPRNPAVSPRESLTLYVARVPGTRDIILSTFKPRRKNVSAEDIAACLYYLHYNSLVDESRPTENEPNQDAFEPIRKIPSRKPVPDSSRSPDLLDANKDTNKNIDPPRSSLDSETYSIRRKPVGEAPSRRSSQRSVQTTCAPSRKPMSSRPPSCAPAGQQKLMRVVSRSHDAQSNLSSSVVDPHPPHDNLSESGSPNYFRDTFSVTVVRRDPSSGAQWNVGVISGHPAPENSHNGRSSSRRTKKPYFDMFIGLSTPGYLHFRDSNSENSLHYQYPDSNQQRVQKNNFSFERKLYMEGSSFWRRASTQRKRALSDFSDRCNATNSGRPYEESRAIHEVQDFKESHNKGYVFTSPWGGRCKFLTGTGGRSLLCQHTLASRNSTRDPDQQSVTVSELRFSIPTSSPFSSLKGSRAKSQHHESLGKYRVDHNGNKFLGRKRSSQPSHQSLSALGSALCFKFDKLMMDDSDSSQYDLSIGREKAGGGSNGEYAKMGKFIVHEEGLKMLDLIVCANMAIWWSVWDTDKNFQ